ncbi:MAG: sugar phosphate isomerase/epimerase [Lachnospiraceae bacterium]|nr:sugar phosphate isomerase/epimerase [Lachnospiraceae bacterium]
MLSIGMTQWVVGNESMDRSFERLNRYGYDEVEFAAEPYTLDAEVCVALMNQYGLKCHSLCGIYNDERDLTASGDTGEKAIQYLRDSVDFAVKVGAEIIIVVPSPVGRTVKPKGKSMEELRENVINNLRVAADYAKEKGIKLAIETINRYETYFINTIPDALQLIDEINHPAVGVMADLFHMNIEERSSIDSIYAAKEKLLHVHIADNTREAAGMGQTDFKEILRVLKSIGYKGSLTMEFMYKVSNPYAAVEMDTRSDLMDQYAKQAIDYIRLLDKSIAM